MSRILFAVVVAVGIVATAAIVIVAAKLGGSTFNPGLSVVSGFAITGIASLVAWRVAQSKSKAGGGRRGAHEAAADDLGFSYQAEPDPDFADRFRDLPELSSNAKIKHVLEGEIDGRPLVIFQGSYMVYTGQTMTQVAHTIYAATAPAWPRTHITPRSFFSRLALRLGRGPALLLENDEFNARFKVKTDDEDFAIALLSPQMQAFLLTKTGVRWRIDPGRLCLTYGGSLKPHRIEASLDRMRDFWSLVPDELEAW